MTTAPETSTRPHPVLAALRGRLVVSCQARPGEPLHGPVHMTAMALSALAGGAVALRVEGPEDIAAVRAVTEVPIIGLWKVGGGADVYITPTVAAVDAVLAAGADVVAVDATDRPRPDGRTLADVVVRVHAAGRLVMADVATVEQGRAAVRAGADLVGSTLAGYTDDGPAPEGPALDLVGALAAALSVPVVAEGRIATPEQAADALRRGAWTVVVGGAITRPAVITAGFVRAVEAVSGKEGGR